MLNRTAVALVPGTHSSAVADDPKTDQMSLSPEHAIDLFNAWSFQLHGSRAQGPG